MAKHDIEITVHPGGFVEAEVHGVKGSGCSKIVEFLKKLGRLKFDKPTKEAYMVEGQNQVIQRS